MGSEPMTFRALARRSATERRELMVSEVTILGYDSRTVSHSQLNNISVSWTQSCSKLLRLRGTTERQRRK